MTCDIVGQNIKEGSLVAYATGSGELRIGIITGISKRKDKYPNKNFNYNFQRKIDLIQITSIDSKKLNKKWYENKNEKKIIVLDDERMPFQVIENYYKLLSKLEDWNKEKNNLHERDIPEIN